MRIVGGRLKGRVLKGPATQNVRPTSDRLREALFNVLAHGYDDAAQDARVIDLFAGTGALGLEAISRGASFALFVDDSAEGRALVRENVEALGLGGVTKIFRRDATKLERFQAKWMPVRVKKTRQNKNLEHIHVSAQHENAPGPMPPQDQFTLAFLDPPYGMGLAEKSLIALRDGGWLASNALILLEESADSPLEIPSGYETLETREYGDTKILILRANGSGQPPA